MKEQISSTPTLSVWWRRSVLLVFVIGMIGLIFMSVQAYRYAPPIPEKVVDSDGKTIFSRQEIEAGQRVFLKYGLMQNGSIWGHGSYLGPDFSAQYLHELSLETGQSIARQEFGADLSTLDESQRALVDSRVAILLKENRYDPVSKQLTFIDAEKNSFQKQLTGWTDYFKHPVSNSGLPDNYINDPGEIRQLTAFFAWTAWASVANRPGKVFSYTNNFPYDPTVGNRLTSDAVLWSALSVAMLLAGLAIVLFTFGRFDYLGWKGGPEGIHPHMLAGEATAGQKATTKYFLIVALLFLGGAAAIPIFYLPAFFFGSSSNFTVVDMWRFWIIHLWVEGFFELFVTVLVAVTFYQLGVVRRINVVRVIYMDAILFLAGGIIGTAHHWYWTGQANFTMALAAMFSALEVVPLTLLTLDAWDFIKLTGTGQTAGAPKKSIPHKWAFYFLMAVGFWNFVGAGIFGFLINMPVVSYFEAGTILTLNHGHAALLGAFGMLAMALLVLGLRHVLTDEQWALPEKFVKFSFWGLNIGLALMVITNLFPEGILQIWDVLENGYWHARSLEFIGTDRIRMLEWVSMPSHLILIILGVVPMVVASGLTYLKIRKQ